MSDRTDAHGNPSRASRRLWSLGEVFEFSAAISPQRIVLLFVAFNFGFLALEVFLSHGWSRRYFMVGYEWIPVLASPLGALTALWLALRPRHGSSALSLHLAAMGLMLAVGIVGFAMHMAAAIGLGGHLTWDGVVYAAPLLAPLAFAGVALVGIVAAAEEDPTQPGRLRLLGGWLAAPFSQQQHLHLLNGLGLLAATLLAIIDHSPASRQQPVVWTPTVTGFLLTGLVLHHAALRRPRRIEKVIYFWAMLGAMGLGVFGLAMHLTHDLAGTGQFSLKLLMQGAPPFAPLLFANMGLLGLLALIEPAEQPAG
ncbi:MAG: hypothetical protein BIFFINMI_02748 [Phycisphaerae bacterium]|nr:hypothetical protein [Phycisphaerae bacterium]